MFGLFDGLSEDVGPGFGEGPPIGFVGEGVSDELTQGFRCRRRQLLDVFGVLVSGEKSKGE